MKYCKMLNEYKILLNREMELRNEIQMIADQSAALGLPNSLIDALKNELRMIRIKQTRLEDRAKVMNPNLARTFFHLKQCIEMDLLPLEKRHNALSFSNAMTAIEGLPVREETEQNLHLWAKGKKQFSDFYMTALLSYGVLEVI